MTDNKDLLENVFVMARGRLEGAGYTISEHKQIDYGIQFSVSKNLTKATLRVYANKKQQVKYDYSQIKNDGLKSQIQYILTGVASDNVVVTNEKEESSTAEVAFAPIIGTDESGKGDYFGPLVCAGVYVSQASKLLLEKLGVRDSKKLSDHQISGIAQSIRKICADQFAVIEIPPETYNNLYSQFKSEGKNLNVLLAWAHAKAIEEVLTKVDCENVLSDKFADEKFIISKLQEKGKRITLRQEHKAESNIAVAAASILAREKFLDKLRKLSNEFSIELSKGASEAVVEQARNFVKKFGKDALKKVAKLHFKTTELVMNS